MTDTPKSSRRDHLITTTEDGKIELTEQELNRVNGGAAFDAFLKWGEASIKRGAASPFLKIS